MSEKDVSRREALRKIGQGLRIAGSGTAYGIAGHMIGGVYKGGRDLAKKYLIAPASEHVIAPATDVYVNRKNYWDEFKRKIKGEEEIVIPGKKDTSKSKAYESPDTSSKSDKSDKQKKEPKEIPRRGFLGYLFNYFNEHPVGTGETLAIYGAGKSYLKNRKKYQAELREDEEKLERAKSKKSIEELTGEIKELKRIILEQKGEGKSLEQRTGGGTLLVIGFSILIVSIILNSWDLTGYAILGYKNGIFSVDVFLFVISLIFIFVGFHRNR